MGTYILEELFYSIFIEVNFRHNRMCCRSFVRDRVVCFRCGGFSEFVHLVSLSVLVCLGLSHSEHLVQFRYAYNDSEVSKKDDAMFFSLARNHSGLSGKFGGNFQTSL